MNKAWGVTAGGKGIETNEKMVMKQYEGPKVEGEDKEASGMCGIIKSWKYWK